MIYESHLLLCENCLALSREKISWFGVSLHCLGLNNICYIICTHTGKCDWAMYYLNESPNNFFEKYDPGFLKGSKDF